MSTRKITKQEAARLGGLARQRLYGDLGTPLGRMKGGKHSLATHRRLKTGFKLLKRIRIPSPSVKLAELMGVLAGDGHIDVYQVTVTTNSKTDRAHAIFVAKLFRSLFRVSAPIVERNNKQACAVVVSSRAVSDFLVRYGGCRGHKVHKGTAMPQWVAAYSKYRIAYIRGLFDTDGSVYVDTHKTLKKTYRNIALLFSNRAEGLLLAFKGVLEDLGLHPTQSADFSIFLRREDEIRHYFRIVGSSNPKHILKMRHFFSKKQGGVG